MFGSVSSKGSVIIQRGVSPSPPLPYFSDINISGSDLNIPLSPGQDKKIVDSLFEHESTRPASALLPNRREHDGHQSSESDVRYIENPTSSALDA